MRKTLLALMMTSGAAFTGCEKAAPKQDWGHEGYAKINDSIVRLIERDQVAEDLNRQSAVVIEEISTRFDKAYYYFNVQDSTVVKGFYLNGPDMYDSGMAVDPNPVLYDAMSKGTKKKFSQAVKFSAK